MACAPNERFGLTLSFSGRSLTPKCFLCSRVGTLSETRALCGQAHLMASALRRPASAQLPEAFQAAAREAWAASAAAGDGGGADRPGMLADVSDSLARLGLANSRGQAAGGGVLKMDICLKLRDRCGRKVRAYIMPPLNAVGLPPRHHH